MPEEPIKESELAAMIPFDLSERRYEIGEAENVLAQLSWQAQDAKMALRGSVGSSSSNHC